jgi:hypothetical protein
MLQDGVSSCEPRSGIEIEAKTLLKEMLQRERGDADKPATKFWPRVALRKRKHPKRLVWQPGLDKQQETGMTPPERIGHRSSDYPAEEIAMGAKSILHQRSGLERDD